MRILQIAPQIPFPLLDGGKVGIFNITKHLAERGHKITLLAFDREGESRPGPLPQLCDLASVRHSVRNSVPDALMNLFSALPYNMAKYHSGEMDALVLDTLRSKQFDVVHVDHLHMAHYGLVCRSMAGLPLVLREHNVESVIMERYLQNTRSLPLRAYLSMQLNRLRRYEARLTKEYDYCCVITGEDKRRLEELQPSVRAHVVSGGVEAGYFASAPNNDVIPHSISFFGGLDWIPNQDAVLWFTNRVFPLILERYPSSRLFIVGKQPPTKIGSLESQNVTLRGYIPDLRREIQRYAVTVAPFRIGGGMRLKILESFAMRVPVVSTSTGCEGIAVCDGEHLLIGDDPEMFARNVLRFFEDESLRMRVTENAHTLVSSLYTWEHVAEELEKVYVEAVARRQSARGTI